MKNVFNFGKNKTADAVDAVIKRDLPSESEMERERAEANARHEVAFLTDCVMRMVAGRDLIIGMNVAFGVIHSLAADQSPAGRAFMLECLAQLTANLEKLEDESPKVQ